MVEFLVDLRLQSFDCFAILLALKTIEVNQRCHEIEFPMEFYHLGNEPLDAYVAALSAGTDGHFRGRQARSAHHVLPE